MKAIVQDSYGGIDSLVLRDVPRPKPQSGEVLVRVRAASVHADVWHVVHGLPYILRTMGSGLRRPKISIPGTDIAGEVEALGAGVTRFQAGDAVFGESLRGHQWQNGGAYAEHVCVAEDALALKPERLSFVEAAAVPTSAYIAMQTVEDEAKIQSGQTVLVNGAAGGVGAFVVQIAKALGATVTAVDHTDRLAFLRQMGADKVIDYTQTDYTVTQTPYDAIIDIPGNFSFAKCRQALKPTGTYVWVGHDGYGKAGRWFGGVPRALGLVLRSFFVSHLSRPGKMTSNTVRLAKLTQWLESGAVVSTVTQEFALADVQAALHCLASGEIRGKAVITL